MRRAAIIGSLFLAIVLAIGLGGILLLEATDIAGPVGRYAAGKAGRPTNHREPAGEARTMGDSGVAGPPARQCVGGKHAGDGHDRACHGRGRPALAGSRTDDCAETGSGWPAGRARAQRRGCRQLATRRRRDKAAAPQPGHPGGRANFPTLLDATLHAGDIIIGPAAGPPFAQSWPTLPFTPTNKRPISLAGEGAYNGSPISLRATTAPFAELHNPAVSLAMELRGCQTIAESGGGRRGDSLVTERLCSVTG